MGKRHEPPPSSSKTALIVLVIGGLLVAGLVGWALTRTVEPAATPASSEIASTPSAVDTAVSAPATSVPMTTASANPQVTSTSILPGGIEPPDAHAQTPEKSAIKRMAVEDLRAKVNRNDVVVIDVRDRGSYEVGHIPGAMHIPMASIETNLAQIPKGKQIVTYCS
jgi:hypothetical protein